MELIKTTELSKLQKREILKIWNAEYPDFLRYKSLNEFDKYLSKLTNAEHFIGKANDEIAGWIVRFDRDGNKWFVVMVNSEKQNKGVGTKLIESAKECLTELNGWVIEKNIYRKHNGELYKSPIDFYSKMGFEITTEEFDRTKFSAIRINWTK
ncbi:MAG: GNAT family N-acetyltransferase [Cyclobacteriaceae bacterium]